MNIASGEGREQTPEGAGTGAVEAEDANALAEPAGDDVAKGGQGAPIGEPAPAPKLVSPRGKRPYTPPADHPTQLGPGSIRFDFNAGCRVSVPTDPAPWRVRLSDLDTGNIIYETETTTGGVRSTKQYFVRFRIEVWHGGKEVLRHDYSARGKDVLVQFPVGTLGDIVGWFPYAAKFQRLHQCRLTCAMADWLIPLFADAYPEITFVPHEGVEAKKFYATYNIGLFFDDDDHVFQPCDFRLVGLHRTAGYILGVDPAEEPPTIVIPDATRPIAEPYVCIAVQSTSQPKYWNNPHGWREIVRFLKNAGYRVICIDKHASYGQGVVWNHIPHGAEDETGDRPLSERARWLKHAEFFVGLSSGLSWLAWAVGAKVVMISGFSHETNEFATPYRVINYHACNSCWNDVRVRFDHKDFLWCPRHKNTRRQFECTRLITAAQVEQAIARIPGFGKMQPIARSEQGFGGSNPRYPNINDEARARNPPG
jgi:autotransporter strand-loop-strand O-heptosyltransferase